MLIDIGKLILGQCWSFYMSRRIGIDCCADVVVGGFYLWVREGKEVRNMSWHKNCAHNFVNILVIKNRRRHFGELTPNT